MGQRLTLLHIRGEGVRCTGVQREPTAPHTHPSYGVWGWAVQCGWCANCGVQDE
jgi:hypothetical protein